MYPYITYDPETGMIRSWLTSSSVQAGGVLLALEEPCNADPKLYIVEGKLSQRPDLPLPEIISAVVGQEVSLGVLPDGCKVYIDKEQVGVADGTEVLVSFPVAGSYQINLTPLFPYYRKLVEVVVNEANT